MHRTIVLFDVEGFTDPARTDADQAVVREALYTCVRNAFREMRIDWKTCYHEDRGDGMLLLLPADVPKVPVVDPLTDRLLSELNWLNGVLADRNRLGMRMAVHAGEVWFDEHGVSGHAVNHAFRLLDADPLRTALARSRAPLALIASDRFFSDVIRHDRRARPDSFSTVRVRVKNTDGTGWLRCFDDPLPGGVPPGTGQPAAVFDMPARRRNFTGRERELEALRHALLAEQGVGTAAVAVHGLGGVGKSRLVVEYAYRHQADYDVVCWVPAGNPVSVRAHLARLGRKLTGSADFVPADEVMSTLWDSMRGGRRWLLVYDDADDPAELSRYWPRGGGHVLITSRNPAWSALAVPFRLPVLSRAESVEFLRRSTAGRDHARLARLAALVGDLPLALNRRGRTWTSPGHRPTTTSASSSTMNASCSASGRGVVGRAGDHVPREPLQVAVTTCLALHLLGFPVRIAETASAVADRADPMNGTGDRSRRPHSRGAPARGRATVESDSIIT